LEVYTNILEKHTASIAKLYAAWRCRHHVPQTTHKTTIWKFKCI